jgi:hypothetical protein
MLYINIINETVNVDHPMNTLGFVRQPSDTGYRKEACTGKLMPRKSKCTRPGEMHPPGGDPA